MEHPWCFLDGSWWVLVRFRLFFEGLWGTRWSPRFGWSPGAVGPTGFRFHCDLLGRSRGSILPPDLPMSLEAGLIGIWGLGVGGITGPPGA